jgi:hypothetical protein
MTKGEYETIMNQYGDWEIIKLRVGRKPLDKYQELVAQGAQALGGTKGKHVDRFFHTYAEFALKHKTTGAKQVVMLEKNQTLKALDGRLGGLMPDHDAINIPVDKIKGRSLKEYEDRHMDYHLNVLKKPYHHYSVRQNNCQVFQTSGLAANGLQTEATDKFVNQPLDEVLPKWFGSFLQPLTDLRAGLDVVSDKVKEWWQGPQKTPIIEHMSNGQIIEILPK